QASVIHRLEEMRHAVHADLKSESKGAPEPPKILPHEGRTWFFAIYGPREKGQTFHQKMAATRDVAGPMTLRVAPGEKREKEAGHADLPAEKGAGKGK